MKDEILQGDIIKVERIKPLVLVVSKDFFNKTGEIIGCPIYEYGIEGPLHIKVETKEITGYVQCEKLALLDMNVRGYKKAGSISWTDRMNITDAVQSIFDYV